MKRSKSVDTVAEQPAAEHVALDTLRPWTKNPDPPEKRDVRTIARSIKRFGFGKPILARRENSEIIAGHATWMAARRLKLATVPVRFMDLSEDEAHALALADNKIAANRKRRWKGDDVKAVLDQLEDAGLDLDDGTGFSEDEIDDLMEDADAEGELSGDASDDTGEIPETFEVLVTCKDEDDQAQLLLRLSHDGYKVKALVN